VSEQVSLTMKSGNRKVGPIPVSTTSEGSCPSSCAMRGTDCYARFGPLGMHWKAVSNGKRGMDQWSLFCRAVSRFPDKQAWRHNQAGDLPKSKRGNRGVDRIHLGKLRQLSKASKHTTGWTYTHYDPTDSHNAKAIKETNERGGLTVNLSADSTADADIYAVLGVGPVVCVLPSDAPTRGNKTPGGIPIVICPAQTVESMSCDQCGLCRIRDRKSVVGFLAHGIASKRLSRKIQGGEA